MFVSFKRLLFPMTDIDSQLTAWIVLEKNSKRLAGAMSDQRAGARRANSARARDGTAAGNAT
jgi:hypothetical protein